jgi:aspartate aminotransferase, cytoplasmic
METENLFAHIKQAPPDPILGISAAFKKDSAPEKVNLGVGAYRTDEGKPFIFSAVKEAERQILADASLNKEYLPMAGLELFNSLARDLLFGPSSTPVLEKRIASAQTISGTGSLRVGGEFIKLHLNAPAIYVSDPTWGNHNSIFNKVGLTVKTYPYWNSQTKGFDAEGMIATLRAAPRGSVILLHASAHNPTGVDPTHDQWNQISQVMAQHKLIPYFDSAYQGFASGDIEKDAYAIRRFVSDGFQLIVSQSFAKNMGLYGERIGALHIICSDAQTAEKVLSQVELIIRGSYSSPPLHGALIASRVLADPGLSASWKQELKEVANRIIYMRTRLVEELKKLNVEGDWSHITSQIGMFSYTGLTAAQCENMINKWHCYMVKNGRISMSGLNSKNVAYVARAIKDSVMPQPKL